MNIAVGVITIILIAIGVYVLVTIKQKIDEILNKM